MPTITGTARTANGLPQMNASIMLLGGGIQPRVALTGIDGVYTFTDVPTGRYRLTAVVGHSVTDRLADVEVANIVVDFKIIFFSAPKTVFDYFQTNRYLLLKYGQYGFLAVIAWLFFANLVGDQIGVLGINKIESPEKARGVITYLIAVTTIGMATILMVASIMIGGKQVKERFALGKEILTLLIGILGTIIGFYYGSTNNRSSAQTNADTTAVFKISPLKIVRSEAPDSLKLTISGTVVGGVLPYSYRTISNNETLFETHKEKSSKDGTISDDILLKKKPTADIPVSFTLTGQDDNKRTFSKVQSFTIIKPNTTKKPKAVPPDSTR